MGEGSFFCLGKVLFYKEVIYFLINNLFRHVLQTSRATGLLTLLYTKKVFKLMEKVFSSLTVHRTSSFHNFRFILMF